MIGWLPLHNHVVCSQNTRQCIASWWYVNHLIIFTYPSIIISNIVILILFLNFSIQTIQNIATRSNINNCSMLVGWIKRKVFIFLSFIFLFFSSFYHFIFLKLLILLFCFLFYILFFFFKSLEATVWFHRPDLFETFELSKEIKEGDEEEGIEEDLISINPPSDFFDGTYYS